MRVVYWFSPPHHLNVDDLPVDVLSVSPPIEPSLDVPDPILSLAAVDVLLDRVHHVHVKAGAVLHFGKDDVAELDGLALSDRGERDGIAAVHHGPQRVPRRDEPTILTFEQLLFDHEAALPPVDQA